MGDLDGLKKASLRPSAIWLGSLERDYTIKAM
jgi:hypothetical protein